MSREQDTARSLVGAACRGCVYRGYLYEKKVKYKATPDFCNYIVVTGCSRPCKAGAGCIVKKTVKKGRR